VIVAPDGHVRELVAHNLAFAVLVVARELGVAIQFFFLVALIAKALGLVEREATIAVALVSSQGSGIVNTDAIGLGSSAAALGGRISDHLTGIDVLAHLGHLVKYEANTALAFKVARQVDACGTDVAIDGAGVASMALLVLAVIVFDASGLTTELSKRVDRRFVAGVAVAMRAAPEFLVDTCTLGATNKASARGARLPVLLASSRSTLAWVDGRAGLAVLVGAVEALAADAGPVARAVGALCAHRVRVAISTASIVILALIHVAARETGGTQGKLLIALVATALIASLGRLVVHALAVRRAQRGVVLARIFFHAGLASIVGTDVTLATVAMRAAAGGSIDAHAPRCISATDESGSGLARLPCYFSSSRSTLARVDGRAGLAVLVGAVEALAADAGPGARAVGALFAHRVRVTISTASVVIVTLVHVAARKAELEFVLFVA